MSENTKQIGISLGWNCFSAEYGVKTNIRNTKENGYKTCPFDTIVCNYPGIVECLKDDFAYFCDPEYLGILKIPSKSRHLNTYGDGDNVVFNTKYRFIFNHESPGHARLYINQQWEGGITHFINNNFAKFIERYSRRIDNFRDYINDPESEITFILTRPHSTEDNGELISVLAEKYPNCKYNIVNLENEPPVDNYCVLEHLRLMGFLETEKEVTRLLK